MKQIVKVNENNGGTVVVSPLSSSCSNCHNELFCRKKNNLFTVSNPNKIKVEKEDLLEIEINEKRALFSVFMTLFFPLLLFLVGYFIGKLFTSNEIVLAFCGLIFIVFGFLLSYLFFKERRSKYSPYIIRKIHE